MPDLQGTHIGMACVAVYSLCMLLLLHAAVMKLLQC
jgi:hypothetical protein